MKTVSLLLILIGGLAESSLCAPTATQPVAPSPAKKAPTLVVPTPKKGGAPHVGGPVVLTHARIVNSALGGITAQAKARNTAAINGADLKRKP